MLAGLIFALALLCRNKISKTKLIQGDCGFKLTVFGFGVIGSLFIIISTASSVDWFLMRSGFDNLGLMNSAYIIMVLFSIYLMTFGVASWRATTKYQGSIFIQFFSYQISLCMILSSLAFLVIPTPYIIGLIIYLVIMKFSKKNAVEK